MAAINLLDAPGQLATICGTAASVTIGPPGPGQLIITGNGTNVGSLFTDPIAIGTGAGAITQSLGGVAIGRNAGRTNQGASSIAIGPFAGENAAAAAGTTAQSILILADQPAGNTIGTGANAAPAGGGLFISPIRATAAAGLQALMYNQATREVSNAPAAAAFTDPIAIGAGAGVGQLTGSIAVGNIAGNNGQQLNAVAIGNAAGNTNQQSSTVAIGFQAGNVNQQVGAVAIGNQAGGNTQQTNSVAIGFQAGTTTQQTNSVAIGAAAGNNNQQTNAVAIGTTAGNIGQQANTVAIGNNAGFNGQGAGSIVIGPFAGQNILGAAGVTAQSILILADQPTGNTIGTGANVAPAGGGLFISPIRAPAAPTATTVPLAWDTTAKEVVSGLSMTGSGAALPTIPGPIEGQLFYRTGFGLHVFTSAGAWALIAGT